MVFRRNIFDTLQSSADATPPWALDFAVDDHTGGVLGDGIWARAAGSEFFGFTNTSKPSLLDPVVLEWDYNVFHNVNHDVDQLKSQGWDTHSQTADPLFLDKHGSEPWNRVCSDFILDLESPAFKLGFKQIDVEHIGLVGNEYSFNLADLGRVDAVKGKLQAERYQRMQGLWRQAGTGIFPGFGFAVGGAWAKYENVDIDCKSRPCNKIVLRMSSVNGTTVRIALDAPLDRNVVAQGYVSASPDLQLVTLTSLKGLKVQAGTIFVMFNAMDSRFGNGECTVDWLRFQAS